jgi:hypothetical protein
MLGFTGPRHSEALVLLDQIEDTLATEILPAVEAGYVDWRAAGRTRLTERAAAILGAAMERLPGVTADTPRRLARLVAERRKLILGWNERLPRGTFQMAVPTGLAMDGDVAKALSGHVPDAELETLLRLNIALDTPEIRQTFDALRARFEHSVALHEAQHRLDYDRGRSPRTPPPLQAILGPFAPSRREGSIYQRTRSELSAYLATVARDAPMAPANLTQITRFLADREQRGSAESLVAVVILEGLSRACGLPRAALLVRGSVDEDALQRTYLALMDRPPHELAKAASKLYREFYGAPPARITPVLPVKPAR